MKQIRFLALRVGVVVNILLAASALGGRQTDSISVTDKSASRVFPKSGLYLGLFVPRNSIGGDFDGTKYIYSTGELVAIPKIDGKFGLGLTLGYRGRNMAFEVSRISQTLSGSWAGALTDVKATTYNFNMKYLANPFRIGAMPSQLFLLAGFAFPSLTVKDGAVASDSYGDNLASGNGHFATIAFNVGVGLDLALTRRVIATGSLGYRILQYGGAKGVSGQFLRVQDGVKGSGMATNFGITFTI